MRRRAVAIRAGMGGMWAAPDIANSGYEVILVEKEPSPNTARRIRNWTPDQILRRRT